jgi:hypothetical protein
MCILRAKNDQDGGKCPSACSEGEPALEVIVDGLHRGLAMMVAVLAARLAGTRAGAQSLVDNRLDCARTATAFRAATKAAIDLLRAARQFVRGFHRVANIVIADDVAGTNNHEKPANRLWSGIDSHQQLRAQRENTAFEAIPISYSTWNESNGLTLL